MMVRLASSCLALGLLAFAGGRAEAQLVTPMVTNLAPSGKDSLRTIAFRNTQANRAAVEVTVSRRSYDEQGRSIDVEMPGDVEIAPAMFILAPGAEQKVRVRYTGPAILPASTTYAIAFRQVPLSAVGDASQVRMLFDIRALAHVVPEGATPGLAIGGTTAEGSVARVTFVNRGTRYGRLDHAPLRLRASGRTVEIDAATLRDRFDLRWIDPGASRTVQLPLGFKADGPVTAEWLTPES